MRLTGTWRFMTIFLTVVMLHGSVNSQESILLNPDEQAPLYPSSSVLPISSEYINPTPAQVARPVSVKPAARVVKHVAVVAKYKPVRPKPAPIVVKKAEQVTLDFQNANVRNVIQFIGDVAGFNMVVGDAVAGTVTIHLSDVTWFEALNAVLQLRNLGYTESDGIYRILPFEDSQQNATICH